MSIQISASFQDMMEKLKGVPVIESAIKAATASAVNKTAVSVRAEAVRMLRKDYNLKATDIRSLLEIRKATADRTEATIYGSGSPGVPLYGFDPTPKRVPSTAREGKSYSPIGGVSVMVTRGSRKQVTGAFAAQMRSGHAGVFQRVPGRRMRGGKKEAIKELFGPSPIKILASDKYAIPLDDYAADTLDRNIVHEVDFYLSRMGAR